MSPVIAAMVVLCSTCASLVVVAVMGSVFFYLEYKPFKDEVKNHVQQYEIDKRSKVI